MTKQQFDDLYLGKAVHCDTEEKANEFLKLAHGFGWKWITGRSLLERNNYHVYQEKTCYLVGRDDFECSPKDFYIKKGYEVVKFKQEKENNMKYKVGDKVRVRSDLVVDKEYGVAIFVGGMEHLKGKQVTIKKVGGTYYRIKEDEDEWNWTDEMLEPTVEQFNVGDVVYNKNGDKGEITELSYLVLFEHEQYTMYANELTKTKPLQKITRKELAKMGYELVD